MAIKRTAKDSWCFCFEVPMVVAVWDAGVTGRWCEDGYGAVLLCGTLSIVNIVLGTAVVTSVLVWLWLASLFVKLKSAVSVLFAPDWFALCQQVSAYCLCE